MNGMQESLLKSKLAQKRRLEASKQRAIDAGKHEMVPGYDEMLYHVREEIHELALEANCFINF